MAKQTKKADTVSEKQVQQNKPKLLQWIAVILLATLIAYLPIFSGEKEFTNWDDDGYVTDQPLIKELNSENLNILFKPSTAVILNYHPLTMISLAIDYRRGYDEDTNTLSIAPFATTSIILHLLNTTLVFIFLYRLGRKRIWLAAIAALLFGIHPMHVESVAWISERKDLLYCFFFLLSCIAYMQYLDKKKFSMLGLSFILFSASCLSKAMAVPLPLVLLLIDYLEKRKFTGKVISEKLPYFIIALLVGYNTILIQATAIGELELFNLPQRLMFAAYGFCMYLVKLLVPVNLSAFYPYPDIALGGLPAFYHIAPLAAIAILVLPVMLLVRKNPERAREVIWGAGFYILTIALVLQFVSVGRALMADRYTYVSYIGPLFIAGVFLHDFIENPKYRNMVLGIAGLFAAICIILTYSRVQVWQNSKTLWSDVIEKYPYEFSGTGNNIKLEHPGVKTAYKNMGDYYAGQKMFDSAFIYYNILAQAGTTDAEVYSNIGNIYALQNNMPAALDAFSKSIAFDSANFETYLKRGVMYAKNGRHKEAIEDMSRVIRLKPDNEDAYVFQARSMLATGDYNEIIIRSEQALKQFPANADLWFCKGIANISLERYEAGIADLQQAIKINPNPLYYYNIASAYDKMGQKSPALEYARQAQQRGFPVSEDFIKKLSQ